MKPSKRLTHAYLFPDRHAILIYEKHDKEAGTIEFAEQYENFLPDCKYIPS